MKVRRGKTKVERTGRQKKAGRGCAGGGLEKMGGCKLGLAMIILYCIQV